MRDQKYLPIRFADRVKRFHDLDAPLLILGTEYLVKCQKPDIAAAAEFPQRFRDGNTQYEIGEIDLSAAEPLYGIAFAVVVDVEVEFGRYLDMLIASTGDAALHVAGDFADAGGDAGVDMGFELGHHRFELFVVGLVVFAGFEGGSLGFVALDLFVDRFDVAADVGLL